uniref:Si:ch73-41e3.7 n=1 Tax=Scleropages formosus TaxID=113540 RepID=A0A8C9WR31_SCLFO
MVLIQDRGTVRCGQWSWKVIEVQRRVCAVAFVDSCHSPWHQPLGQGSRDWLKANAKKWVLSCKPLNRPVGSLKADCPQLSAGTQCHEAAPATCMDPLFRFFAKAVKAKPATVPFDIITRSKSRGRLSQGTAAAVPGKP